MHEKVAHVGMWACTWMAFLNGIKLNGGPEDDYLAVLFWILCGFTMWFLAVPQKDSGHKDSGRQGS